MNYPWNPRSTGAGRGPRSGLSGLGVALLLGIVLALVLGWWWTADRSVAAGPVDSDRIVVVEERDLIDGVTANGRVEPLARVAVMSRASGIVKELLVEEGDVVQPGQVLAELDREQLEAQLAQDRADLRSAEARLAGAQARVQEAELLLEDPELEFLEREAERLAQLFEAGDVSLTDKENAARELAVARFRIDRVRASLPILTAAVDEARADLAAASAELERSETTLREATIKSPIEGVVLVRDKEVGDGVSSILTAGGNATQIMMLGDLRQMHVEARVDEVDLGRIFAEMPAIVTVDAHRGHTLSGRVERIAPSGSIDDNGIVTFEVRISVADPDGLLRPDMTADAKLVIARRDGVPTLPQRALARASEGGWTVQRLSGEGATAELETVPVELGLSDGLMTEIRSGLAVGDRVLLPDLRR